MLVGPGQCYSHFRDDVPHSVPARAIFRIRTVSSLSGIKNQLSMKADQSKMLVP